MTQKKQITPEQYCIAPGKYYREYHIFTAFRRALVDVVEVEAFFERDLMGMFCSLNSILTHGVISKHEDRAEEVPFVSAFETS